MQRFVTKTVMTRIVIICLELSSLPWSAHIEDVQNWELSSVSIHCAVYWWQALRHGPIFYTGLCPGAAPVEKTIYKLGDKFTFKLACFVTPNSMAHGLFRLITTRPTCRSVNLNLSIAKYQIYTATMGLLLAYSHPYCTDDRTNMFISIKIPRQLFHAKMKWNEVVEQILLRPCRRFDGNRNLSFSPRWKP